MTFAWGVARLVPVAVLAGGLVTLPASPAAAANCPAHVTSVTGENPSYAVIAGFLAIAAREHGVPPQLLKSIAYQEGVDSSDGRRWAHFDVEDDHVIVTGDTTCDVGIMQVNALRPEYDEAEQARLASDVQFNIAEGARVLREKWEIDQADDPAAAPADDPKLIENWYWATCAYNGCTGESTAYVDEVVARVVDPFRYAGLAHEYMPPVAWTRPQDADPTYVFPAGFVARRDGATQEFVFYDSEGATTKTVPAPVHDWTAAPPVVYPHPSYGPDKTHVTCRNPGKVSCLWWRLDPGKGVAGRSHWTGAVSATEGNVRVTWSPPLWDGVGTYRLEVFVPSIGPDDSATTRPKGPATYHVTHVDGTSTVVVDQSAYDDRWVSLGVFGLREDAKAVLTDHGTPGTRVVADALRYTRLTRISAAVSPSTVRYGQTTYVRGALVRDASPLPGHIVRVYSRRGPGAPWVYLGARRSDSRGNYAFPIVPERYTEYHARYIGVGGYATAISNLTKVSVAQVVWAGISTSSMPLGRTAVIDASVTPGHPGGPVHLQRLVNGTWRDIAIYRLSSTSRVRFTSRPGARGTYYFRVYRPGDRDHLAGASRTLTLRVY